MFSLNSNLQAGDIILVRGGKLHSKAIAHASGGHFSHACLCIKERTIIESITSTGVQYSSVVRFAFANRENVLILRPNFQDEIQKTLCQDKIVDAAAHEIGKGYDLSGASKCLSETESKVSKDKCFCSQLVANIFLKVGIPLFDKPSEKVNPNDFPNCNNLHDVTNIVLSEIPKYVFERYQRMGESIQCLDEKGSSKSDAHRILSAYFKKIAPIFKKHNIAPPKNIPDTLYVLVDPWNRSISGEIDREITKKFDKMKIMTNMGRLIKQREADDLVYLDREIEKYGEKLIKDDISYSLTFIAQIRNSKKNIEISLATCHKLYDEFKFKFLLRAIEYYKFSLRNADDCIASEQIFLSVLYKHITEIQ